MKHGGGEHLGHKFDHRFLSGCSHNSCSWRSRGDPLCDEALETLVKSPDAHGIDMLEELQRVVLEEKISETRLGSATALWNSISIPPPPEIRATGEDIFLAQQFFAAHVAPITIALLHFSLGGGFAS